MSEVCNFANDNTLHGCNKGLKHEFSNLKYDLRNVLDWFKINSMKLIRVNFNLWFLDLKI